jgi:hypothetical protein
LRGEATNGPEANDEEENEMAIWKNLVIISGLALLALNGCQSQQADDSSQTLQWEIEEQGFQEASTLADTLKSDDSLEAVTDPKLEKAYLSLVDQHPVADLVITSILDQGCEVNDQDALILTGSTLNTSYTVVDLTGNCPELATVEFAAVITNGLTADIIEVSARIIDENNEIWSVVHDLTIEKQVDKEEEGNNDTDDGEMDDNNGATDEHKSQPVESNYTTLLIDEGIVFASGDVIEDGSGFKVDMVVHKHGNGLDLKAGRQGTDYLPLNDFGALTYQSIADVPCEAPNPAAKNTYKGSLAPGQGLTLTGNVSAGLFRVRIVEATGSYVTIEYAACL